MTAMNALTLETFRLGKRFGDFVALDEVSMRITPGTVHALLGENGAGKSTLVKCISGYHRPDAGALMIDQRETVIASPREARALGIGMVYQHFTVAPGMSVAENLLLARGQLPARIHWRAARAELEAFMAQAPFALPLDAHPVDLSAGERQKLEILKQLLLKPRLLILDEPTSVLTPQEADEVLSTLAARARLGECSILLITHKFREVHDHADEVTVLRRGRMVLSAAVKDTPTETLALAMVGDAAAADSVRRAAAVTSQVDVEQGQPEARQAQRAAAKGQQTMAGHALGTASPVLQVRNLTVAGDRGQRALNALSLEVHPGEILGLAGVAGNGQQELLQALTGQRRHLSGEVQVAGERFDGSRAMNRRLGVRALPQEPLLNACVPGLSVMENLALRDFDQTPWSRLGWIRWARLRDFARDRVAQYRVKTPGLDAPMQALSGGNVQRAVLSRELVQEARLLLVSNPGFGLDFAATEEVHRRLRAAAAQGCAVLLISEDLDEILLLADRVAVISEGRIVLERSAAEADKKTLGAFMAGASAAQDASGLIPGRPGPHATDLPRAA
jgi:simple sugar transport system ATP-binding protein